MFKSNRNVVIVILLFAGIYGATPAWSVYGGGSGSTEDPYLIFTENHFNKIGLNPGHWDQHFKLMSDLNMVNLSGSEFNIIGLDLTRPFTGVFDGNDMIITNFSYTAPGLGRSFSGLFGAIHGNSAEIKNLGLVHPEMNVGISLWAGPLVGFNSGGLIVNCHVLGGQVNGFANVGGLVGENSRGLIYRCYSTCGVPSGYNIGGLTGQNSGIIAECLAIGQVSGASKVGGLVGWNTYAGVIANSFAVNAVSGSSRGIGGFVGFNSGWIQNSYSAGEVSADLFVGGLIGCNLGDRVLSSFWNTETSGHSFSAGGVGFTAEQMTVLNSYSQSTWDFESVWGICETMSTPWLRNTGRSEADPDPCPSQQISRSESVSQLVSQWLREEEEFLEAEVDIQEPVPVPVWAEFGLAWQSTPRDTRWKLEYDVSPPGGDGVINARDLRALAARRANDTQDVMQGFEGDAMTNLHDFANIANNIQ
jgi:hypothetical protein